MAYVRTGQFEPSIKPLEKAISFNPKLRQAYINLSGSYVEVGKDQEALQVLQRAEKIFPDDVEVLYSLGSLHYHLMFKIYGKMARLAPNSYRYDQVMGQSFEEREEYPAAIVEFQNALKENPQAPGLHYALGNVYWIEGQYANAKREFEAELQIAPEDYLSTWKLGNSFLQERQFDKALPYLRRAIEEKPSLGGAYEDLGKLYVETNDNERAIFYLKKVVQMDPAEPSPHYLLALVYRRLGNTAEAQTETSTFQSLKKSENERRRPPDAMFPGAGAETERIPSKARPDSH
jgi:tetratricopeptide (TPR) repeat protein